MVLNYKSGGRSTAANSLKLSSQCTKAAATAMQVLGLIKRKFVINDEEGLSFTV